MEESEFISGRFVVGPYEEKDFGARVTHEANTFYRQQVCNDGLRTLRAPEGGAQRPMYGSKKHRNAVWHLVVQMLRIYKRLIYRVKCFGRHQACPHPFSCFYYVLGVSFLSKLALFLSAVVASGHWQDVQRRPGHPDHPQAGAQHEENCLLPKSIPADLPQEEHSQSGIVFGIVFRPVSGKTLLA